VVDHSLGLRIVEKRLEFDVVYRPLQIHNVELLPGKGGQLCRAAGTSATLVSRGVQDISPTQLAD